MCVCLMVCACVLCVETTYMYNSIIDYVMLIFIIIIIVRIWIMDSQTFIYTCTCICTLYMLYSQSCT